MHFSLNHRSVGARRAGSWNVASAVAEASDNTFTTRANEMNSVKAPSDIRHDEGWVLTTVGAQCFSRWLLAEWCLSDGDLVSDEEFSRLVAEDVCSFLADVWSTSFSSGAAE